MISFADKRYKNFDEFPWRGSETEYIIAPRRKVCAVSPIYKKWLSKVSESLLRKMRVVDFGGSLGKHWWKVSGVYDLDYIIIECKDVISDAKKHPDLNEILFLEHFAEVEGEIDFFYSCSSVQYWKEDAEDIVERICRINPSVVLFEKNFAIEKGKSFMVAHVMDSLHVACWIWSKTHLVDLFAKYGYELFEYETFKYENFGPSWTGEVKNFVFTKVNK